MTVSIGTSKAGFIFSCLILLLITVPVYWPVMNHGFVKFDDNVYVTGNKEINSGITLKGLARAFRFPREGDRTYYHPLAYISHMVDCELFGLNPSGHHLMNLGFHIANTLLLLGILFRTGIRLPTATIIAAIFALHPLQVESVAWVAERKNLLSTFFWLLAIVTYIHHVKKWNKFNGILLLLFFSLGLLTKPVLMTLPFTLLLLDLWPLERFRFPADNKGRPFPIRCLAFLRLNIQLFREKFPLFLVSGLWFLISMHAASRLNESPLTLDIPMDLRLANALVSYVRYILNFFWPFDLAVFYPYPRFMIPLWQIWGAIALLVLITIGAIRQLPANPSVATGWFWFAGTLFPAMGLTQTGLWPAMADRWMYVPMIGILLIFTAAMEKMTSNRSHKIILCSSAAILLMVSVLTRLQVYHWSSQTTLFHHAAAVVPNNHYAHYCIGLELLEDNKDAEALDQFSIAMKYNPDSFLTKVAMGQALIAMNEYAKAMHYLQSALKARPNHDPALFLLGLAYLNTGHPDTAIHFFNSALVINPDMPLYHNGLGLAFIKTGNMPLAINSFRASLSIDPHDRDATKYLTSIFNNQEADNETAGQQP
ncbi:MAG: tetratricopeptide repeat protein [Thermodesulfobacteriota bacterium]